MNKTLITLLVSGLLAANAQAAGQDNTWYGGAKLGWSNFYGVDEEQHHRHHRQRRRRSRCRRLRRLPDQPEPGDRTRLRLPGQIKYSGTRNAAAFNDSVEAQLAQLTLKLGFPVADNLDLYGRLGGGCGWTSSDELDNDSRAVFVGALGAEYALNLDWAARLEYQYSTPYGSREDTGLRMDNGLLSWPPSIASARSPQSCRPRPGSGPEPVVVDKQFTLSSGRAV